MKVQIPICMCWRPIKKILQHPDLWDVKRKPPPRVNDPPLEAFIIYDESSAPSANDYIIDADYPMDLSRRSPKNEDGNLPLKNPAPGKAVSYAQNCLNDQIHVKKSVLTIKLAFVTRLTIGSD